jgi:predicted DNA-binding protein (MmcQ/YjbR family)
MNIEKVRALCEAYAGATVDHPWGPEERVYKVGGKSFAFLPEAPPWHISLKCDPELARILRERYAAVKVPRYLNKQLWNMIEIDGSVPDEEIEELIAHSYELVAAKLPKALRAQLAQPAVKTSARAATLPARNQRKTGGAERSEKKSDARRADR